MTSHTAQLQPDTAVAVSPKVRWREIGDESVLVDLAAGEYFGLNEVGTAILEQLMTGATLGQVCATLVETFEVEPDRAWSDLVELVGELLSRGLVKVTPVRGAPVPEGGGAAES